MKLGTEAFYVPGLSRKSFGKKEPPPGGVPDCHGPRLVTLVRFCCIVGRIGPGSISPLTPRIVDGRCAALALKPEHPMSASHHAHDCTDIA